MDKTYSSDGLEEINYQLLFDNMLNGLAYCQMVYDNQGKAVDFIYLAVNKRFGELTGITQDVVGKHALELFPEMNKVNPEVLETYARVIQTGKPEHLEIYFKPINRWLSISVYRPKQDRFVAVFDNITDRKNAEEKLKAKIAELEEINRLTVGRELVMVKQKKQIADLKKNLGQSS